jgi:hypothetical protein
MRSWVGASSTCLERRRKRVDISLHFLSHWDIHNSVITHLTVTFTFALPIRSYTTTLICNCSLCFSLSSDKLDL